MALDQHLVIHLQEMVVTEKCFRDYLNSQAGQIHNAQLKAAVSEEIDGIQSELDNLTTCLDKLGAAPKWDLPCPIIDAFKQEDTLTMDNMPAMLPADMDVHLAVNDIAFGHLEVGYYQAMIAMAKEIGETDVVDLLKENLRHEHEDLREMQQLLPTLTGEESGQSHAA